MGLAWDQQLKMGVVSESAFIQSMGLQMGAGDEMGKELGWMWVLLQMALGSDGVELGKMVVGRPGVGCYVNWAREELGRKWV
jgi:hypothetical protein